MNQHEYFSEKIETLPEDLQFAILSSDWEKTISDIQKEFKLHLDQGQVLETAAMQLMFSDIDATDFINLMFREGHISTQVAADILLAIDSRILKKIRESLEIFAKAEKKEKEDELLNMTDEEKARDEEAERFAKYYSESAVAIEEARQDLEARGIADDGSNATDEQIAEILGVSVEEYRKGREVVDNSEIPTDINKEKEELLRELETPQKSFVKPLFTQNTAPEYKLDHEPLAPDHQLENTHIETPYHEPEPVILEKEEPVVETVVETPTPVTTPITPEIKKPTKISISTDIYREPIE